MTQTGSVPTQHPICGVFAYGTLKRGQCRERCWPHPPQRIEAAYVLGQLHDLGEYPALVDGRDRIAGELWHVAPQHLDDTLRALDVVEGATGGPDAWFVRRLVTCYVHGGGEAQAWIYYFAQPARLKEYPTVAADADGLCRWPRGEV
jgi:gamma-glutamylcyclotransferase (GGCT)/AIG2-like uncharacterized protein YtfP